MTYPNAFSLEGKVALVTGAASGIGRAVALVWAREGARVVLSDLDEDQGQETAALVRELGAEALFLRADASSAKDHEELVALTLRNFGRLDAACNNAGIGGVSAPTADYPLDAWNAVLAVNLTGYLLCSRAFGQDMLHAGRGSLVHVASVSALHPQTASGAYSASKAGVLLMSRQMAVEWGPQGIRSNAICPGMIRTALSAKFYEEAGFEQKRAAVTASRRIGEPQDIADVALFLASPRSAYVNAAEIVVDGGMSSMLMDMVPRPGFNHTTQTAPAIQA